jgi:ABC-type uncharacterized transport system ATPase subunit
MASSSAAEIHIRAAGLTKRFRVAERRPGTLGALAGVVHRRHRVVTAGLDAVAKLPVRDCIGRLRDRGVTVILTTHDMDDIETLCDRVIVISAGRIVLDGSVAELYRHG